jgi:phage-related protein
VGWAGARLKAFWALLARARAALAVGAFHGFVAVLRTVAGAFGAILHPVKSIRIAFTGVRAILASMGGLLKSAILHPIATLHTVASALFSALRVGFATIGRVLMANPIGLIITAIALAAYVLIRHWDKVKAFFAGFWEGLTEVVGPVFSDIGTMLSAIFSDLRGVIEEIGAATAPLLGPLEGASGAGYAVGKIIGWALWVLLIPIRLVIAAIGDRRMVVSPDSCRSDIRSLKHYNAALHQ